MMMKSTRNRPNRIKNQITRIRNNKNKRRRKKEKNKCDTHAVFAICLRIPLGWCLRAAWMEAARDCWRATAWTAAAGRLVSEGREQGGGWRGGSLGHAHMLLCACKECRMYSYTRMCVCIREPNVLDTSQLQQTRRQVHKQTDKRHKTHKTNTLTGRDEGQTAPTENGETKPRKRLWCRRFLWGELKKKKKIALKQDWRGKWIHGTTNWAIRIYIVFF